MSRISSYNDLRILPMRENSNLDYLLSLHQNPKHVRYTSHLVDGFFKEDAPNKISKNDMDKMMKKASKNIINQPRKIFYPISNTTVKLPINTIIATEIAEMKIKITTPTNILLKSNLNIPINLIDNNIQNTQLINNTTQTKNVIMHTKNKLFNITSEDFETCVKDTNEANIFAMVPKIFMETKYESYKLYNEDIASLNDNCTITDAIMEAFFRDYSFQKNNYEILPVIAYSCIETDNFKLSAH